MTAFEGRVRHDATRGRYEYMVDGAPWTVLEYRSDGETVVMHHTYADPALRGRGVAGRLVAGALDDLRARRLRVVPTCSFVGVFLDGHPEYRDLLAGA